MMECRKEIEPNLRPTVLQKPSEEFQTCVETVPEIRLSAVSHTVRTARPEELSSLLKMDQDTQLHAVHSYLIPVAWGEGKSVLQTVALWDSRT